jgi:REP element-mobilizing transposase RayT
MKLYRAKYRVESARLNGWDYSSNAHYFVTICTKSWICFFGEVIDGTMNLSTIGEIAAEEWQKTEQIRPNVRLDEWVIMPNHIHGIIVIENEIATESNDKRNTIVETSRWDVSKTRHRRASTGQLLPNSLSSIIGQFKSVCTKRIRKYELPKFAWQPRFYDHIIRSEESLNKAREYIRNNPLKWESDKNNPVNL